MTHTTQEIDYRLSLLWKKCIDPWMRRFFSPNAVSLFNTILVKLVCNIRVGWVVVCTSTRLLCLVGGGEEDRVNREDESGKPGGKWVWEDINIKAIFFRGICWSSGNLEQKNPKAKNDVGWVQKKSCHRILLLRPCAMPHPIRCPHPSLWGLPHMLHHASCHMAHMNHHDPLESVLVSTHPTLGWPGGISTTTPSVI